MRWYVCQLEEAVIRTCTQLGVPSRRTADIGIWADDKHKIAAIGVHCRRWITSHGLALNCNVNLRWFNEIVPCGLVGKGVTSLTERTGRDVSVDEALPVLIDNFQAVFECKVESGDS